MSRPVNSGWAFAGCAVALLLLLAGLLLPRPADEGHDRVVMIGVRGLSWQAVIDQVVEGRLPVLAALMDDGAAIGDIIADGYDGEEQILLSIVTGRLPFKQPGATVWEELIRQGHAVSVSGFPVGRPVAEVTNGEAAVKLLREEPRRHLFLYLAGLRGASGEPVVRGYELLDELLGRLIAADGGRSTFLLFSEMGNPEGRITYKSHFPELGEWPATLAARAWCFS